MLLIDNYVELFTNTWAADLNLKFPMHDYACLHMRSHERAASNLGMEELWHFLDRTRSV